MMKYVNNKYVFFILIFIAVFLFDFIIFQVVFVQIINHWPDNVTLGMTLIFSSFFIIPATVAYYIAVKRHQGKLSEIESKKASKRIKITIALILTIVLVLFFKGFTEVKFEPYTYRTITDGEFKRPLKIIATKKIGENEYYLKETEESGVSLYQQAGNNRQDDKFIFDLPSLIDSKSASDFWFDSSTNTTFVVTVKSANPKNRYEQIFKYLLNTRGQEPLQVLKTTSLGLYSGDDKILDYFSDTDTLLMKSGSGDGCWGEGTIWFLNKNVSQTLQEYGGGCALKEKPRYVGYDGNFLYFAIFDPTRETSYEGDLGLKEILKINPQTGNKTTVNANFPDDITWVNLSEDKKAIIMSTDKGRNFLLDLVNKSSIKEASSSAGL